MRLMETGFTPQRRVTMDRDDNHPGVFAEQLDQAAEQWAPYLPAELRASFRKDLRRLGLVHDTALKTIEGIWERHERTYKFDESTGLATRRPFRDHLATTLLHAQQSPASTVIGVLFIDVNNLKAINDTCGHHAGDTALAAVGSIVREALRVEQGVDIVARARDDAYAVARHGGDEFVAALKLATAESIEHVAPRIKRRADDATLQRTHGYTGSLELSIAIGGVAYESSLNAPGAAPNSIAAALLAAADTLMYRSKRDGCVHVALARFGDKLEVHAEQRLQVTD